MSEAKPNNHFIQNKWVKIHQTFIQYKKRMSEAKPNFHSVQNKREYDYKHEYKRFPNTFCNNDDGVESNLIRNIWLVKADRVVKWAKSVDYVGFWL